MATFVPEGPSQAGSLKDTTGSSSVVVSGNSALPGFASALPDVINKTVQFVDSQIKDSIAVTARDVKENEDRKLLEGQEAFLQQSATIESLPQGVVDKTEALAKLKNAYENGVLSESAYYSRLDAAAREMRSRYPGYVDQIDQSMSRLTGVNPANYVARDIMSRIQKVTKDPSNADALHVERELRGFGFQPPTSMPLSQQKELAAAYKKADLLRQEQKQDLELRKADLSLRTDSERYNLDKADRAITQGIQTTTQAVLGGIFNDTVDAQGVRQKSVVAQMEETVARGEPFSEQLKNQATAAGPRIIGAYRSAAMQHVNSLGGLITSEQRNDIVKRYTEEGERYARALVAGDVGALTLTKKRNEAKLEDGVFITRTENDTVRNIATLSKALGADAGRVLELAMAKTGINDGKGTSLQTYTERVLGNYILSGVPVASQSKADQKSPAEIAEMARIKGLNPATFVNNTVKSAQSLVVDKTLSPDLKKSYIEFLTNPKMDNYTATFTTTKDKEKAYATISDPKVVKAVRDLENQVPGVIEKHNNTIVKNGAIVLREFVDTAKEQNGQVTSRGLIKYDPDRALFFVDDNPNFRSIPGLGTLNTRTTIEAIADSMNITVERMSQGLIPKGQTNAKVEDINRLVEQAGFVFTPIKKETVDKQFKGRLE